MTDDRSAIPIACTLGVDALPARRAEWQAFAHDSVRAIEQDSCHARALLASTDAALVAAASLGQRETECCAFFEFVIVLEADQRWLSVTVPAGAEAALASFMDLLGQSSVRE